MNFSFILQLAVLLLATVVSSAPVANANGLWFPIEGLGAQPKHFHHHHEDSDSDDADEKDLDKRGGWLSNLKWKAGKTAVKWDGKRIVKGKKSMVIKPGAKVGAKWGKHKVKTQVKGGTKAAKKTFGFA